MHTAVFEAVGDILKICTARRGDFNEGIQKAAPHRFQALKINLPFLGVNKQSSLAVLALSYELNDVVLRTQ